MIIMTGKTAPELCAEYRKYREIKESNALLCDSVLEDIGDALYAIDPMAGFAFAKALSKDENTDPAEFFGVTDAPPQTRRRRS